MKYNFNGFTEKGNLALNYAIITAEQLGHTYVGSEHLLLGILKAGGIAATILEDKEVSYDKVENLLVQTVGKGKTTVLSPEHLTPRAKRILENSIERAKFYGNEYVGTEHILICILSEGENYANRFLTELGVDVLKIQEDIFETAENNSGDNKAENKPKNSKTKTLDKFGIDLTEKAKNGKIDPVIGREKEIERVIEILGRRSKNNPVLIGEPGVGKTAIAEGLALKIANDDIPETVKNKRIIALDLTGMVAGTKYRGDFEERIKAAIDEAIKSNEVILFIDELLTIMGAGSAEGSTDAANILKPTLARGELRVIGATTLEEYRKNIEKDSALERRFQPVTVDEPTKEDAIEILKGLRDKYEAHHKVKITDGAISAAVMLSSRYITDRFLPDKAIDLIDEASSKVRLKNTKTPKEVKDLEEDIKKVQEEKTKYVNSQDFENAARMRDKETELRNKLAKIEEDYKIKNEGFSASVKEEDIANIVSSWTGVPVTQLTEAESKRLLKMENILHDRIVGQNEAVKAVSKAIRRGRVGIKDKNRPIGSFIFLGPTGVGKTELCKALAWAMFGSEDNMLRLDMSEYMEKHTVSKLIGSPPGYVGYDEGGQLTEKIRRKPYSVVLFDEIEKAHPDVFNMLLQILEDGHITDSQGRRVDFKNTIIIMTSNIGARNITDKKVSFGFGEQDENLDIKNLCLEELKKEFRPEFLNRVDDIIVFHKLEKEHILKIAENMLKGLSKRLNELNINLTFTKAAVNKIADVGFDKVYGARPLRRAIVSNIEDKLSEKMLEGDIKAGDTIECDYSTEYTFLKK